MENLANQKIHPGWLRITHWVNAVSIVIMVMSGWRIYNSSPIFAFKFPGDITLGGWLAGALQWHFAAMWLLVANGLIYLLLNFSTGRFRRKFFPLSIAGFLQDFKAALKGHLAHEDLSKYNMVQKVAYLLVILDAILLVVSGLVIWKSVQFPLLRELMGGYENARVVHFYAMSFIVLFFVVHLAMVALVPRTFVAMIRGR